MRPIRQNSMLAAGAVMCGLLTAGCFFADDDDYEAEFESAREGLEEAAQGLGQAGNAMKEALEGMVEGGSVDQPLGFREFYEFFGEEIEGFERVSRQGSTKGAMGMDITTLEMRYEREDGARIDVEFMDLGALPVAAVSGFIGAGDFSVDEESDRGWKRSTKFHGYPAMEEFQRSGDGDVGRATFSSLIEGRFALILKGRQIEWDDLMDFRDEIDTDDIADLKDQEG